MGERTELRRKVLFNLLSHPLTLFPVTGGLSAIIAYWSGESTKMLAFGGVAAILLGLGSLATRWIFGREEVVEKTLKEIQSESTAAWEARLDELDERLQGDSDARTEALFRELRALSTTIRSDGISERLNPRTRVEISLQVDELYAGCIKALENSLVLFEKAQTVRSEASRSELLEEREQEIREVSECVQTLEGIYARGLGDGPGSEHERSDLARIRSELGQSLEVARRVEKRMKSLERGIPDLRER